MGAVQQDLEVIQGKTFTASFGWAQGKFVWKTISAVANAAPVSLTVVGHDLRDGWPFWISDLKKPACLNNVRNGCEDSEDSEDDLGDPYLAEVIDVDTLSINHINGMRLDSYAAGGVIRYYARADITGYNALMQVRRSERNETVLFEASSEGVAPAIVVDEDAATFNLTIPADSFDDAAFTSAIYEIEITAASGERYQLAYGCFTLSKDLVK